MPRNPEHYLQVLIAVYLLVIACFEGVVFFYRRRCNDHNIPKNKFRNEINDLISYHHLNIVLIYNTKAVYSYNFTHQILYLKDKSIYNSIDYVVACHELAHALDYKKSKNDLVFRMFPHISIVSQSVTIIVFLFTAGKFHGITETVDLFPMFLFLFLIRILYILCVYRIEAVAHKIMYSEILTDKKHENFMKISQITQLLERSFILFIIGIFLILMVIR